MKQDIILCGVGGQGILSIATVIGQAATLEGVNLKQAEVHGMSQRGGDVQSNLRLSTEPIHSDLIALGCADIIISMEPMEALRYKEYLSKDGSVVTSSEPFVNIPSYPSMDAINEELSQLPDVLKAPIETLAKDNNLPKSANIILLGMASRSLKILSADSLKKAIAMIFARKGQSVVDANLKAFEIGVRQGQ